MSQIKKSTVVLYGSAQDPEVKASRKRIIAQGRNVEIQQRPNYDTGMGPCGKHQCHCTEGCEAYVATDIGQIFGVRKQDFQII